jgi:hypothetical protein
MIMTTFWLTFSSDAYWHIRETFRGVAIFDLDESDGELSDDEVLQYAEEMGLTPEGKGYLNIQDATEDNIPAQYKNRLITDDETLVALGADMTDWREPSKQREAEHG